MDETLIRCGAWMDTRKWFWFGFHAKGTGNIMKEACEIRLKACETLSL